MDDIWELCFGSEPVFHGPSDDAYVWLHGRLVPQEGTFGLYCGVESKGVFGHMCFGGLVKDIGVMLPLCDKLLPV